MTDETKSKTRNLELSDCFAKGTWISLGMAVLCLSVDIYFVFYIPLHRSEVERGVYHPSFLFLIALRTIESVLAVLSIWLVRHAFSRPPRLPANG